MFAIILVPRCYAAQIAVAWDENSEPDIAGYKIYYGTTSGNYQYSVDVRNNTSCLISGLTEGTTYYLAATAYDTNNDESSFSEELVHTVESSITNNHPPTVSITSPTNGVSFDSGAIISFDGVASDTEDGDLTGVMVWTSDLQGQITTGQSFTTVLNDGTHTITAEVTDSGGSITNDSITITVGGGSGDDTTITLTAAGKQNKKWRIIKLDWSGATSTDVDIWRDGAKIAKTSFDGAYTDKMSNDGGTSYIYQVCEADTFTCSNEATVNF
jgi:hypothetical protein